MLPHHNGRHHAGADLRGLCQPCGYGSQSDNGAYGCSYGEGDETGGDEHAGKQQIVRKKPQRKLHGGVNGSHIPGRLGEGSCQHEIQTIIRMFRLATPEENRSTRSAMLFRG